ncbi:MAG: oligosaccharide flippase family protein [Clostridia bacterium]|nr:oligosaccharide flippase family protein [Clostridia bacterium]
MNKSKKIGAILSYLATILTSAVSIFLTPFILSRLGDAEYGVYRIVQSFTGQLALISIGLGTIASVFIAKYNVRKDENALKEKENFVAMGITIATVLSVILLIIGGILFFFVDDLYANTMTSDQLQLVNKMYVVLVINVALYLFRDIFVGIVHGYERFVYCNGLKVLRILLRVALIIVLLGIGMRSLALVLCDLALTVFMLLCDVFYCFFVLKLKAKFHFFDKALFRNIFSFSLAMFLQTFVNQVNQNLGSVILGAMVVPELVTVYALALSLYLAFNSVVSSIATLYTPEAAQLVQRGATEDELSDFTIKVGRIQAITSTLIVGGFLIVGRQFVEIWTGASKMDVYYLALILMVPTVISTMFTGANSLLDAYMKRMGRSIILLITAIINIVLSIVLIRFIGYWGAAISTAVSVVVGQIIAMCIYYKKVFGFKVIRFFIGSFKGILLSLIIALAVTFPFGYLNLGNLVMLLVKGVVFVAVYGACMLLFGMTKNEKQALFGKLFTKRKAKEK